MYAARAVAAPVKHSVGSAAGKAITSVQVVAAEGAMVTATTNQRVRPAVEAGNSIAMRARMARPCAQPATAKVIFRSQTSQLLSPFTRLRQVLSHPLRRIATRTHRRLSEIHHPPRQGQLLQSPKTWGKSNPQQRAPSQIKRPNSNHEAFPNPPMKWAGSQKLSE